jgi:putative spermidine/putrescine transport system permease protein
LTVWQHGARSGRKWSQRHPYLLLCAPAIILSLLLIGSLFVTTSYSFFSVERGQLVEQFTFRTWAKYVADPFFWDVLRRTVQLAGIVTVADLIIGFPAAYALTRVSNKRVLGFIYVAIFSPLVVSTVVRTFGWLGLLGDAGLVNTFLQSMGVISSPIKLAFNITGVQIAMVHSYVPFMVFPLLNTLRKIDKQYGEVSTDLGAGGLTTFRRVVLPLSLPGILAGCTTVFTLAVSAFVTPELMGGGRVIVASRLAWENVTNLDWPQAAIQVFSLLMLTVSVFVGVNVLSRFTYLGHLKGRG